jgi:hypothetical protein
MGKKIAFRADAAFAKPEIYEALEERSVKCAIPIPANENLEGTPPMAPNSPPIASNIPDFRKLIGFAPEYQFEFFDREKSDMNLFHQSTISVLS